MRLKDKVALITGSNKGIGKAIAIEFAKEGANLVLTYNRDKELALRLEREIKKEFSSKTLLSRLNLNFKKDIDASVKSAIECFGKVDILVNNGGVYHRNNFYDSNEEIWAETMNVNLKAPFFLCKEVSKIMIYNKYGNIINISSNITSRGKEDSGIEYGISKAGLEFMTKSLAITFAPYVRVNAIAPGYTNTRMAEENLKNSVKMEEIIKKIPLKRINEPEDIAKVASFLVSEDSRNITGQVLNVDGGIYL